MQQASKLSPSLSWSWLLFRLPYLEEKTKLCLLGTGVQVTVTVVQDIIEMLETLERVVAIDKGAVVIAYTGANDTDRRKQDMAIYESLTQVPQAMHLSWGYHLNKELL